MDRRIGGEGEGFEQAVQGLMRSEGFGVESPNVAFDFFAFRDGKRWAVEVKYYRSHKAQIALLGAACARFAEDARQFDDRMLIVSCVVHPATRAALENQFGVAIVDRADLYLSSRKHPNVANELDALWGVIDNPEPLLQAGRPIATIAPVVRLSLGLPFPDATGTELCGQLRALEAGRPWRRYEELGMEILQYLFPAGLSGWREQHGTEDGLNRFDCICRIDSDTSFWKFVVNQVNSRYVLFEFKNYSDPISQGEVLTTEKYLFNKALRTFALVLCRKGASESAAKMARGAMREHGKLILIVDDDDVCEMLHMRERGKDPSDLLFDRVDEFLMSMPR